jgi:hypothetical protein
MVPKVLVPSESQQLSVRLRELAVRMLVPKVHGGTTESQQLSVPKLVPRERNEIATERWRR